MPQHCHFTVCLSQRRLSISELCAQVLVFCNRRIPLTGHRLNIYALTAQLISVFLYPLALYLCNVEGVVKPTMPIFCITRCVSRLIAQLIFLGNTLGKRVVLFFNSFT